MDIPGMDLSKTKMRLIMYLAQRELKRNADKYQLEIKEDKTVLEAIHDDLSNCSNLVVRRAHKRLLEAADHMGTEHHGEMLRDLGSFMLWIAYKDTAYRDPFFWMISKICDDEELQGELRKYYHEPSDWYCSVWTKTKEQTKRLREDGRIDKFRMSREEEIFVPTKQHDKWVKIMEDELEVAAHKKQT